MLRKLPILILLFATTLFAKDRVVTISPAASVTGVVSAVNGNLVSIAGGAITIDVANAKFVDGDALKPGMLITATVQDSTSSPLVASAVAIIRSTDLTLTGTVQSVDVAGSQFSLLGKSIRTNASTTFVNGSGIASVQSGMMVLVEANVVSGAITASRVTLIAPIPPRPETATGTVKSIGSTAWVITVKDHDTTFVINAATKILGDPKVGDKVEVLFTVDSAHANVALSIMKSIEAPKVVKFSGVVKSLGASSWVITRDDDHRDVTIKWPDNVRLFPAVAVGDHVDVVALENSDGTYTLVMIVPRR
jgi:hypothetical protein